jgi:CheY-like chemotaxis protein
MSEATAVAVAAVIPEEKLIRVLVIDDEETFQQDMTNYFDTYRYSVDVARNLEEAKTLLEMYDYQIALVDVNFPGIKLKGDSFVLENRSIFKDARVIVVTGRNINQLRNRNALEKIEIPVWDKGDVNWGRKLTGLTEETAEARKQEIASQLNDFLSDKLGDSGNYVVIGSSAAAAAAAAAKPQREEIPLPEPWELAVEDILLGWLENQSNPERPFFSVGRAVYSPQNMIEQVQQKTEFGKELLGMFVTEVKYSLGLGGRPTFRR